MGAAGSTASADIDNVAARLTTRVGKIPVSGRFHTAPRRLDDDYIRIKNAVVGKGMNGSVYKATSRETHREYAVKEFDLLNASSEQLEDLEGECEIFLAMDHPHVARLTDVYKSNSKLFLVMELMEGGEMFERIMKKRVYKEADAADAAYQMLLAINYIHQHSIVHRDIKLENFLYEKKDTDHLKLIDFGFGKIWNHNIRMSLSCGTLNYVAPEVLNKSYGNKCDLWSFGVLVFILVTGYMPFGGSSQDTTIRNIKAGKFTKKPAWDKVSKDGRDFIGKLLQVNPMERMSAEQALEHAFIKDRSERAKHAEVAEINSDTLQALVDFSNASKFRQACMSLMAWSLTNEDRMELRESFLAMDKNKTGTITLGEFQETLKNMGARISTKEQKQIFANLHSSCTEEIAYSEFLAAMVNAQVGYHTELLKSTFRKFDTDNNGFIDVDELKGILGDEYRGEDVASMMKEADLNNDGRISLDEFIAYAKTEGSGDENKVALLAGQIIDKQVSRNKEVVSKSWIRWLCLPCS